MFLKNQRVMWLYHFFFVSTNAKWKACCPYYFFSLTSVKLRQSSVMLLSIHYTFRFLSSAIKTFSSMPEKTTAFPPKHENTSGVNHSCFKWRILWLYSRFFLFSFFLWTAGRLWSKWHLANGLKTHTSQKTICLSIYNPLADTSALAWLLVFEEFGSSSPVNGVSNSSIPTFLRTSPSISAIRFLSLLCLVITRPPFRQDKACCKLSESPQTHSVNKLECFKGKIASVCF